MPPARVTLDVIALIKMVRVSPARGANALDKVDEAGSVTVTAAAAVCWIRVASIRFAAVYVAVP